MMKRAEIASDAADWIDRYRAAGGRFSRMPPDGRLVFSVGEDAFAATAPILAELEVALGMRDAVRAIVSAERLAAE